MRLPCVGSRASAGPNMRAASRPPCWAIAFCSIAPSSTCRTREARPDYGVNAVARRALIIGVTGQDGAYLARLLLDRGYEVHGTSRDAAVARLGGLAALGVRDRVELSSVSPIDFRSIARTVEHVAPDEIYNLSGQSSVALSFEQ